MIELFVYVFIYEINNDKKDRVFDFITLFSVKPAGGEALLILQQPSFIDRRR